MSITSSSVGLFNTTTTNIHLLCRNLNTLRFRPRCEEALSSPQGRNKLRRGGGVQFPNGRRDTAEQPREDNEPDSGRLFAAPVPGGLYDAAMGPLDDKSLCKSCGQTTKHCPDHFGHIELVSPVYNPLTFNIPSNILQRTCFSCHHFQSLRKEVDIRAFQLELIMKGDIIMAKNLESIITEKSVDFFNPDEFVHPGDGDVSQCYSAEKLGENWTSLQFSKRDVATGICRLLEKKEGIFRQKMMGKMVYFACRSVISPDPYLAVNEIGIPPYFALRLSYPISDHEFEGKVVYRHLKDGDVVLANRQPTLHKPSIMAHIVRVLKGEKTVRMHYANCRVTTVNNFFVLFFPLRDLCTYNADFDGDEINVHFPQDEISRAEAYNIVNANNQYVKPTSGDPIRALIQDHIVSAALLTKKDTFLSYEEFNQLLYSSGVSMAGLGSFYGKHGQKVFMSNSESEMFLFPPAIWKPLNKELVYSNYCRQLDRSSPYINKLPDALEGKAEKFSKQRNLGSMEHADFVRLIEHKYVSCLTQPGEPVGVLASQSVGEPATQMTQGDHHQGSTECFHISVNIRHLKLNADFMTHSGGYCLMNRTGSIADSTSLFIKMCFETAAKFIVEAAYHGQVDNLETPSARICIGLPVKMGTGCHDLIQKLEI
ncbi:DNA-directed RNA polymerase I subunit RPA1 [Glycine soja]|uniref:DNA-directed RNA polymerase subunit n=1 Tax=Glycine soja TaxID=3848 RepID=A0A0B2P998_GLYSO|nr:DNA-directed RNA polymerase I subunit RPA1 [Glycine soja]